MKKGVLFLMLMLSGMITFSCSNTKSYGEMLKDEKKTIKKLIADSGFVILDKMPENMKFGPKEFVQVDGIYLNIVDTGNGKRAEENKTLVYFRFIQQGISKTDTMLVDYSDNDDYPLQFNYPLSADYGYPFASTDAGYYYTSEGTSIPLKYVGEHGIVKLIIPFKKGSESDQNNGMPRYYMWLKYTKFD